MDGRIRQWGKFYNSSSSDTNKSVTFPLQFKTENYTVVMSQGRQASSKAVNMAMNYWTITKTGFTFVFIAYAYAGYIAEGY